MNGYKVLEDYRGAASPRYLYKLDHRGELVTAIALRKVLAGGATQPIYEMRNVCEQRKFISSDNYWFSSKGEAYAAAIREYNEAIVANEKQRREIDAALAFCRKKVVEFREQLAAEIVLQEVRDGDKVGSAQESS